MENRRKTLLTEILKKFLLFLFILAHSGECLCHAWGTYGHRVVAAVAENVCSTATRNAICEIVGKDQNLADLSTWADEIKGDRRDTAKWHYVLIPKKSNVYVQERDCPKSGCLLSALKRFQEVLNSRDSSRDEKEEALKFLVHLVGDLHQPLHCGYREDRGGNWLTVRFFGRKSTLHKVWDTDILARNETGFYDYVDMLSRRITPERMETLKKGTFTDWAMESRSLLRDKVYDFDSDKKLGQKYYDQSLRIIDDQLLKAGIRLGWILNKSFAQEN